jgi:hypothetical protein
VAEVPHRTNHNYRPTCTRATLGRKAAFVEQVTNSFDASRVPAQARVGPAQHRLPAAADTGQRARRLASRVIIATASSRGRSAGETTLQGGDPQGRVQKCMAEAEKLADADQVKGPEDCRAFAHKGMKLSCPTGCFRALLASSLRPRHPSPWLPTGTGRG